MPEPEKVILNYPEAAKRRAISPSFAKKMTATEKAEDKKERKPLYSHPSSKKM